jgi:hypothetical protein
MSVDFTIARKCAEPDGRVVWEHVPCDASFNLANGNAALLLRAVGLPADPCGCERPEVVLAACAVWTAVGEPAGRPQRVERGAGGALMIEMGATPEYVRERVRWLERLALLARDRGGWVGWA